MPEEHLAELLRFPTRVASVPRNVSNQPPDVLATETTCLLSPSLRWCTQANSDGTRDAVDYRVCITLGHLLNVGSDFANNILDLSILVQFGLLRLTSCSTLAFRAKSCPTLTALRAQHRYRRLALIEINLQGQTGGIDVEPLVPPIWTNLCPSNYHHPSG